MNSNEQKLTIENLLSSKDIFARCIGIIKPEYFDPEYRPSVQYISEYFEKYHNIPSSKAVNAKFEEMGYEYRDYISEAEVQSSCDEIEIFCKRSALYRAIEDSYPDISGDDPSAFGRVLERVQSAMLVSIEKDMGINMFDNPEEKLKGMVDVQVYEPTGIKAIDEKLGGGLARQQFTLFSANSGGGKSIMLANIGANYAKRGYHVLTLALELTETMIYLRNASIMSGVKTVEWKEKIPEIAHKLKSQSKQGGSYLIKRIKNGSTANDIRAYIEQYTLKYKHKPDVIIVDYIDLMTPNGGTRNMGIAEQDKLKSEQLAEVGYDYNAIMLSASQQNREALRLTSPDQGVIAGGITKVNTVDNYISIFMDNNMRVNGDMAIFFLKTRSSSAVGTSIHLKFNADNLQITDSNATIADIMSIPSKKKLLAQELSLPQDDDDSRTIDDVIEDDDVPWETDKTEEKPTPTPTPAKKKEPLKTKKKELSEGSQLLELMQSIGGIQ